MKSSIYLVGLMAVVFLGQQAVAQTADEQMEEDLMAVREGLAKAYNSGDLDMLLSYCHDDVMATWQNGQVAIGHQGVRDVVSQLTEGDSRILAGYTADPQVDHRVVLNDGQTVVSVGSLNDEYTLVQPKDAKVQLDSKWTTTLAKIGDDWKIVSFHVSTNAFDNQVISLYSTLNRYSSGAIAGVAAFVVGLLVGLVCTRLFGRSGPQQTGPASA